jgi:putative PIN family toxin of toxin-antitoxin system
MMRIFVDTNIIVSAILFPKSVVASVFEHIIDNHTIILSDYVIKELHKVFNKKFPENHALLQSFLSGLFYEFIEIGETYHAGYPLIRDKNDQPILVAAIDSKADILLTGDKDFSEVETDKLTIMNPGDFLRIYM